MWPLSFAGEIHECAIVMLIRSLVVPGELLAGVQYRQQNVQEMIEPTTDTL